MKTTTTTTTATTTSSFLLLLLETLLMLLLSVTTTNAFVTRTPTTTTFITTKSTSSTKLFLNPVSMIKHFGKKVTASHILIGPSTSVTGRGMIQDDAKTKLLELKEIIQDSPDLFAQMANEYSSCRATNTKGGDLGTFGPGIMVGPFDDVCFEEQVGKVHGPISTPFGEHLIYIHERT